MIWYLLYPIRGTSNPPRLPPENPIRRAFYRHGALTARYWLLVMLFTVATGVFCSYPTVFLSDFPPGSQNALPHHVWTGSISFEARTEKQPDLEMRQVWLQGDYMAALNRSMLDDAFVLHELLFADLAAHASMTPDSTSWGLHSPTTYWNDSRERFTADVDPIKTINTFTKGASLAGLELQPLSTLAGKLSRNGQVTAADAIVLTLVNHHNSSIGAVWQEALADLPSKMPPRWHILEASNSTADHSIYEYKYQPFSFRQSWALTAAYLCMVVYVTISLRRVKAFKSKAGLVVTAVTQMTTSILASFTLCGLLKINLAQVPQEAYPFVVLTIGLENIFRLINAVVAYPPQMATTQRIANGIGDIGHASLASVAQNLAILWVLSLVVSPGVAAFCAFAAIAIIFDFYYLMTFFVAVLNVDIKRLELQDALVRPRAASRHRRASDRRSWVDAVIHGGLPASTRMAGSVVMITFVMVLNWHFSDHNISSSLRSSPWSTPNSKQYLPLQTSDQAVPSIYLNETSTQTWFGVKGSTATTVSQFMHIIKPGAQSFTARIFDPLIIVLADADRTGVPLLQDTWLSAVREAALSHFYPSSLAVVFMIAFTTVLMNFLLWDERADVEEIDMSLSDEGPLMCKTIVTSHRLDIVEIAESDRTNFLSVGLDRTLALSSVRDRSAQAPASVLLRLPISSQCHDSREIGPYSIENCVTDKHQVHVAALCRDGTLLSGTTDSGCLDRVVALDVATRPVLFNYVPKMIEQTPRMGLVILESDGSLHELDESTTSPSFSRLVRPDEGVVTAVVDVSHDGEPYMIIYTRAGSLLRFVWQSQANVWLKSPKQDKSNFSSTTAGYSSGEVWLSQVSSLGFVLLSTPRLVQLLDTESLQVLGSITVTKARPQTVRLLHSEVSRCRACDSLSFAYLAVAYTEATTGDLVLTSYSYVDDMILKTTASFIDDSADPKICLSANSDSCNHLSKAPAFDTRLANPGQWEATALLCVAGVRRPRPPLSTTAVTTSSRTSATQQDESPLRRRRRISHTQRRARVEVEPEWEGYMFTHSGNYHAIAVHDHTPSNPASPSSVEPASMDASVDTQSQQQQQSQKQQLYATTLGPVARLSPDSVGVALGNSVVVVRVSRNPDAEGVVLASMSRGRGASDGVRSGLRGSVGGEAGLGSAAAALGLRRTGSKARRTVGTAGAGVGVGVGAAGLMMSRRNGRGT